MKNSKVISIEKFNKSILNRLDRSPRYIKLAPIRITKWGLPVQHGDNLDNRSRNFIKLYLDKEQIECGILEQMINDMDNYYQKNKRKLFTRLYGDFDNMNSYEYSPVIKKKIYDNGYEDNGYGDLPQKEEHLYCNFKLLMDENDDMILTNITVVEKLTNKKIRTFSELEKYLTINSVVDITIKLEDVWRFRYKNTVKYGPTIHISNMIIKLNDIESKQENNDSCNYQKCDDVNSYKENISDETEYYDQFQEIEVFI